MKILRCIGYSFVFILKLRETNSINLNWSNVYRRNCCFVVIHLYVPNFPTRCVYQSAWISECLSCDWVTLFFLYKNVEFFDWGWTFLNIFGISASNVLKHVLKISLLILDNINNTCTLCGTFLYTLICTCTFLPLCLKRYIAAWKNCGLVNEKTCDVKLLSANFSQEAHRKANFLTTMYKLIAIGYHNK